MDYQKIINRLTEIKQGTFHIDILDEMTQHINRLFGVNILYCNYIHYELSPYNSENSEIQNRIEIWCDNPEDIDKIAIDKHGCKIIRNEKKLIKEFIQLVKKYNYYFSFTPHSKCGVYEYNLITDYSPQNKPKIEIHDICFNTVFDFKKYFLYSVVRNVNEQIEKQTDFKTKMGISKILYDCSKVIVIFDHSASQKEKIAVTEFIKPQILQKDIFNYLDDRVDFLLTDEQQYLLI